LIELGEIELWLAIECHPRASSRVRSWRDPVVVSYLGGPLRLLPRPEPEEVVVMRDQEIQICRIVERIRRINRPVILEVAPGVRASEVNDLTRRVFKVSPVGSAHVQQARKVGWDGNRHR